MHYIQYDKILNIRLKLHKRKVNLLLYLFKKIEIFKMGIISVKMTLCSAVFMTSVTLKYS